MKHTPAPWLVAAKTEHEHSDLGIIADNRFVALSMNNPQRDGEREANARLIAAAPDMLEALKAMLLEYDAENERLPAYYQALAAINKAEGK